MVQRQSTQSSPVNDPTSLRTKDDSEIPDPKNIPTKPKESSDDRLVKGKQGDSDLTKTDKRESCLTVVTQAIQIPTSNSDCNENPKGELCKSAADRAKEEADGGKLRDNKSARAINSESSLQPQSHPTRQQIPSSASTDSNQRKLSSMAAPMNHSVAASGAQITQQVSHELRVDDDESEDEEEDDGGAEEILEESPCGRYHKRKERVTQRDVPGIDAAFLAMDTDYAVQVVWNEVVFSQRKSCFKPQAASIKQVFDNLMLIDHPNIIKVHKYWTTENKDEKPRLIFITEYMPSRNMKQFLKTTRSQTQKQMGFKVWKRWCIQMLSALSYLHSVDPPIIHGNLNCETLFIQHNGLLKIGSIAPDAIHTHVKTCKEQQKHFHFIAPEYAGSGDQPINEAVDIYAFGMCALEMAVHGLTGNGENVSITEELIEKTLQTLQAEQADFIRSCIAENPKNRPSARELLFRPIIFEVHQLKLLSAHVVANHDLQLQDNPLYKNKRQPNDVFASIKCNPTSGGSYASYVYGKLPQNDLEKLLEDVSQGLFPLTNYAVKKRLEKLSQASSVEENDNATAGDSSGEAPDPEMRMIVSMSCEVHFSKSKEQESSTGAINAEDASAGNILESSIPNFDISLKLKLDDNTTRFLNSQFSGTELPILSQELVDLGFINESDKDKVNDVIRKAHSKVLATSLNVIS